MFLALTLVVVCCLHQTVADELTPNATAIPAEVPASTEEPPKTPSVDTEYPDEEDADDDLASFNNETEVI